MNRRVAKTPRGTQEARIKCCKVLKMAVDARRLVIASIRGQRSTQLRNTCFGKRLELSCPCSTIPSSPKTAPRWTVPKATCAGLAPSLDPLERSDRTAPYRGYETSAPAAPSCYATWLRPIWPPQTSTFQASLTTEGNKPHRSQPVRCAIFDL